MSKTRHYAIHAACFDLLFSTETMPDREHAARRVADEMDSEYADVLIDLLHYLKVLKQRHRILDENRHYRLSMCKTGISIQA